MHNVSNTSNKLTAMEIMAMARELASRASLNNKRGSVDNDYFYEDKGAHLLSSRSREKLLKGCAPDGAANASSEIGFTSQELDEKGNAVAPHLTLSREDDLNSLCSSKSEVEVEVEHTTPADLADLDEAAHDAWDFYEIKTDLFDNLITGKKSTRHRAKLMIRSEPTTKAVDADVFMLDFYNRTRDANKRLKALEVDDNAWYLNFLGEFEKHAKMLVHYDIAPKLALLKQIDRETNQSEAIAYAAGIMFQIRNQSPVIILYWGASRFILTLDFEFERSRGSTCFAKGIRRDPKRSHLDVDRMASKPKFKAMTKKDFS